MYALLAVSVIISLFGIVNTLVLSVYERTREIGMLRAIGTTRRQMRRIVRYESVITSVIGGILGTVLGVVFAYVVSSRLASQGITFSVPWGQLVGLPHRGGNRRRGRRRAAGAACVACQHPRGDPLRVSRAGTTSST